jgi:hypothetical protein
VAASDGLFDNMWDDQLLAVLNEALGHAPNHDGGPSPDPLATAPDGGAAAAAAAAAAAVRPCHRRGIGGWASWGRTGRSSSHSHGHSHSGSGGGHSHHHGLFGGRLGRADSAPDAVCRSPPSSLGSGPPSGPPSPSPAPAPGPEAALSAPCELPAAAIGAALLSQSPQPQQLHPPATPGELAQRAADALARAAFRNAQDDAFKSPWAVAAGRQGLIARLFAKGGKMDDCTCVVAIVSDAGAAEAEAAEAEAAEAEAAEAEAAPA